MTRGEIAKIIENTFDKRYDFDLECPTIDWRDIEELATEVEKLILEALEDCEEKFDNNQEVSGLSYLRERITKLKQQLSELERGGDERADNRKSR